MSTPKYDEQVFINCPFDDRYINLFRATVFTILDSGFLPRCSLEEENGSNYRLSSILTLIKECQFGVHDLSRVELDSEHKLPRFNMPFELGLFYSAKHFGDKNQKCKKFLILENEKFSTKKYLSDISGIDVNCHMNSEERLIKELRHWLVTASKKGKIPQPIKIQERFNAFMSKIKQACLDQAIDLDSMPFIELVQNMTEWLELNTISHSSLIE